VKGREINKANQQTNYLVLNMQTYSKHWNMRNGRQCSMYRSRFFFPVPVQFSFGVRSVWK